MKKIELKAEKRKVTGRKVKVLRGQGILPANIYGKDVKSEAIEIKLKEFKGVYKEAGETGIIDLTVGKESKPVLIHNVQVHPATDEVLHVDFLQVNLKEKITAAVPVEVTGESPAEKSGLGTVVLLIQELEVEALPGDLPENFEVDATKLTEVDQTVKVADLKYDKEKIKISEDAETILVKVEPPQKEEVIEVAPAATEGTAEGTEEKPAEGTEAPKEGETPKDQAPAEQK